jgi:hypothetical protein
MQYENERAIMPYLLSSESLTWTGRPATGLIFRKSDVFLIPFSLAWGGFACFWEYTVYRAGAPYFFLLFGGFFVVMGLYLIFGRFFYDMLHRRKTVYALTGERILSLTGKTLSAWNLRDLPQASLELSADRRGTIAFGVISIPGIRGVGRYRGAPQSISLPVFEKIQNASDVFNMIESARSKLSEKNSDEARGMERRFT